MTMTHPTQEDDVKAIRDALYEWRHCQPGGIARALGNFQAAANPERLARLLARLEQAERDAARWRFDRRSYTYEANQDGFRGLWYHQRGEMTEDEQDAAIDNRIAAIASEAKP